MICSRCFKNVREFTLDDLPSLNSVKIGLECFTFGFEERNDGSFRISNCPDLRHLEIGHNAFGDYKTFELSNVNSLQSIDIGSNCFAFSDLKIKGMLEETLGIIL